MLYKANISDYSLQGFGMVYLLTNMLSNMQS